jgi:hypothetical protein
MARKFFIVQANFRGLYYKTLINHNYSIKARVFVTVSHFHPSQVFAGNAGAYPSGALTGLDSKGRLLALPKNIKKEKRFYRTV